WQSIQSWFPTLKPTQISAPYAEFSRKWNTRLWRGTLRRVLGWYVQANAYGDVLEARIIPAFVALETLAWVYIVEDQRLVSAAAFSDRKTMNAALRISRLLQELNIPSRIPAEHGSLRRAARARQATDGPQMIAKVRNDLVHPKQRGSLHKSVLFQST